MLEAVPISETSVYSSEIHGAISQKAIMFRKILNCEHYRIYSALKSFVKDVQFPSFLKILNFARCSNILLPIFM
jgi:hypothetical protein